MDLFTWFYAVVARTLLSKNILPIGFGIPARMGSGVLWMALPNLCMEFDLCCFSLQGRCSLGFSRVQLSEEASLQFVHSSETLTLTLNHTAEHLLEADIKLFRKYFWDRAFLVKVCVQFLPLLHNSAGSSRELESVRSVKWRFHIFWKKDNNALDVLVSFTDLLSFFLFSPSFVFLSQPYSWDKVCFPGWPWTHSPPASLLLSAGIRGITTTSGSHGWVLIF
jgi:hypothetical protein